MITGRPHNNGVFLFLPGVLYRTQRDLPSQNWTTVGVRSFVADRCEWTEVRRTHPKASRGRSLRRRLRLALPRRKRGQWSSGRTTAVARSRSRCLEAWTALSRAGRSLGDVPYDLLDDQKTRNILGSASPLLPSLAESPSLVPYPGTRLEKTNREEKRR